MGAAIRRRFLDFLQYFALHGRSRGPYLAPFVPPLQSLQALLFKASLPARDDRGAGLQLALDARIRVSIRQGQNQTSLEYIACRQSPRLCELPQMLPLL
jgi:hypothetical protein